MIIYLYANDYPNGGIPPDQRPSAADEPPTLPYLQALMSSVNITPKPPPSEDKLMNNVLLYVMAEKYDLSHLKDRAKERFLNLLGDERPSTQMVPVIIAICDSTPPADQGLRKILTEFCAHNIDRLMQDPDFTATMEKYTDFSFGALMKAHELDKQALEHLSAIKATVDENLLTVKAALRKAHQLEGNAVAERGAAIEAQKKAVAQKDFCNKQKSGIINERDEALKKGAEAMKQVNRVTKERDEAFKKEAQAIKQLDQVTKERDAALRNTPNFLPRLDHFLRTACEWHMCRNCGNPFGSYWERFGEDAEMNLQLRCGECKCRHDLGAGRD